MSKYIWKWISKPGVKLYDGIDVHISRSVAGGKVLEVERIKSVLLFDYFKEAFRVNRTNKELYGPQIALALVKMVLVAGFGIWAYTWLGGTRFHNLLQLGGGIEEFLPIFLGAAGLSLAGLVMWLLVVRLVEAGLFNMYKTAVETGSVQPGSFGAGVAKFFLPFVLGDILIALVVLITSPIWAILGVITLTMGFTVGAIALGAFLMFWKVSLVWNDAGIIEAIKDSFRFAWSNVLAVTMLFLVRQSFASPWGGSRGVASNIYIGNFNGGTVPTPAPTPGIGINPNDVIRYLRIGVSVFIPVLIIIVTVAALIKMIFEVFFGLTLFVTYKHGFRPEHKEVGPDVV